MTCTRLAFSWAVLVALSAPTQAQEAPRTAHFTDQGRTLVAGSIGGYWSSASSDPWAVWLAPTLARFLRDRVGLGLQPGFRIGFEPIGSQSVRFFELSLGVLGMFELPLNDTVGLLVTPTAATAA